MKYFLQGNILVFSLGYLFFENLIICIILCPLSIMYIKYIKNKLIKIRKRTLKHEFLEALEAIAVLLKAGNSIETSFKKVVDELQHLQGEDSYMIKEIIHINNCIELDVSIEKIIMDFALRANIPEITNFADVFIISKRSEGNIVKVIQTTCNAIRSNININSQIKMSISGVLQEITIMRMMPLGILIYLKVFGEGYFEVVHNNIVGQIIMGIILIIYIIACTVIEYMQRKVFGQIC